ncbi:16S rRNA (cytosine(1402)-N(4))-methyltransferase RsmH [Taylorella asinigenitalis]|uniref:Ribosomal RNA small subunit methyltransferase H n=1 Tax=Taylorella asinigenitalis (strain MCE3) TaxID=1008459 RepID=G4QC63_TAYAM|nr:16S rRNA (cytosine(1402)-N(4))-methyltransferase RsmH [Taylorella asinigenitalis]AEP37032.1 rRNA small subunit methyltransferase H [Taylorella asinigenitalis MCE3]
MEFGHVTVLLYETINALVHPEFHNKNSLFRGSLEGKFKTSGVFVDGTFGRGGHSRYLLSLLGRDSKLFVFDRDPQAIEAAKQLKEEDERVEVVHGAFSSMQKSLSDFGIQKVDGITMDLGISSPQIDDGTRGFSFMRDGPLDMRMDNSKGQTAAEWINSADVELLAKVIKEYGEERFALKIAKAIASRRESNPIRTTHELAELVSANVRTREKGQHPATRTFQAIRIYINEELEELSRSLATAIDLLKVGGRLSVISFHSLEDRIVKQFIAKESNPASEFARLPIREIDMPKGSLKSLGKLTATEAEIASNPRSRSAILRVAERTDN